MMPKSTPCADGGCPVCGAANYNEDTFWCAECEATTVRCPLCRKVVYRDNELAPCRCIVGIYGTGPGEWIVQKSSFVAWRRRWLVPERLSGAGSDEEGADDESPADDLDEVRALVKRISWIKIMVVGDDGAFGHCYPDYYFLVRPTDQRRLQQKPSAMMRAAGRRRALAALEVEGMVAKQEVVLPSVVRIAHYALGVVLDARNLSDYLDEDGQGELRAAMHILEMVLKTEMSREANDPVEPRET